MLTIPSYERPWIVFNQMDGLFSSQRRAEWSGEKRVYSPLHR